MPLSSEGDSLLWGPRQSPHGPRNVLRRPLQHAVIRGKGETQAGLLGLLICDSGHPHKLCLCQEEFADLLKKAAKVAREFPYNGYRIEFQERSKRS